MKKRDAVFLGLATVALAGLVLYTAKKVSVRRKLKEAANEGYETAHDILFPTKNFSNKKIRLGPILPE